MPLFSKSYPQLLKGCKANERSAQEALYRQFYTEMLRLCHRYLRSDELAKEALNTGFLKVFLHIHDFDERKSELKSWIKTIIIRTCIDLSRKEAKFTSTVDLQEGLENTELAPEVLNRLYVQDVLKAVRQLPVATQLVFNLSVIEGYTHAEIAKELGISEGTSRWHLSQAKKQLRGILEPTVKPESNATPDNQSKIK
jgi:RNA polymerase sigma factor (sigma-70 family)